MNLPTRGQWRGYTLLCCILTALLLLTILLPRKKQMPEPASHSRLEEAIARYEQEMVAASEKNAAGWRYSTARNSDSSHNFSNFRQDEHKPRTKQQKTVEINSADTTDLMGIYGIGPVFANRIVKYRSLLGGFANKEQLMEVYGMTDERFRDIEKQITIDTTLLTRIDINTVTLQQLKRHPYLDYYQAKAILEYRKKVGHITSSQDLLKINLMDEVTAKKITPYIQFN